MLMLIIFFPILLVELFQLEFRDALILSTSYLNLRVNIKKLIFKTLVFCKVGLTLLLLWKVVNRPDVATSALNRWLTPIDLCLHLLVDQSIVLLLHYFAHHILLAIDVFNLNLRVCDDHKIFNHCSKVVIRQHQILLRLFFTEL